MQMLIMGLFAVMVLVFALALYVSNVRDVAVHLAGGGEGPQAPQLPPVPRRGGGREVLCLRARAAHRGRRDVLRAAIVFMILMAFTDFGGEVVHPVLASWSLSAWQKILGVGEVGGTFGKILVWNVLWAVVSTAINFFGGLGIALLLGKRNVRGSKIWRAFPILAYAIPGFISMLASSSCSPRAGR